MSAQRPKHVTIVGGGFSGAAFAHHLLRMSPVPVVIDIAEERPRLGAGVAYSAAEPHQVTNISAPRMSVYPDDRPHFARWLSREGNADHDEADAYPQRAAFGRYMDELVRGTIPAHPGSALRHHQIRIDRVERTPLRRMTVQTEAGATWAADAVVLATGNPLPRPPASLLHLKNDPRVILDPWQPGALDGIKLDARVLILGLSLTMGEVVAGLTATGHRGSILAIARRGQRSARGMTEPAPPFGNFDDHRPTTALKLLRHFRAEVQRAEKVGLSWRSVLVTARTHGWEIWACLPPAERRRFVRHLRPFWEALRHVMPGPVYDLLKAEEQSGRLHRRAASLRHLAADAEGLQAELHCRGTPHGAIDRETFDIVLNCTGPAYTTVTTADPFWADLAGHGLVTADRVGLGIAVDGQARAVDWRGTVQPDLLVLGTLARGTFGELTGVPELSRLALQAARGLVASWQAADDAADIPFKTAV